ncbi:DUF3253 domain-containing protein [Bradyrhizobium sp. LHD-71]|uniref:DUF3253 domain-containing protein n=1 Tax=Bradyrhizobium sp. LHD-71 TaxID=3072141 RepID=UPI00280D424F|nr:DUF3253 domain-containing protein [Bradyrhizobium sp. LHD-71]MDQ8726325.1 DUF3253 domain-containing protein [Bradyrhizobium sp. LHD-71]
MFSPDSADASAAPLEIALLKALGRVPGKTLSAPELAQEIAVEGNWHDLLVPIRRAAVKLALDGRLIIYRKGRPADPSDFRGVYRLGLPRHD